MREMKNLLLVLHTPSDNTQRLAGFLKSATQLADIDNVTVIVKTPLQTQAEDVLKADAIIIGTTENFGYMAGLTKDFERIYYPVLEQKQDCLWRVISVLGSTVQVANAR